MAEIQDPANRTHFWERPEREDEVAAPPPVDPVYPMHVHQVKEVKDEADAKKALDEGWLAIGGGAVTHVHRWKAVKNEAEHKAASAEGWKPHTALNAHLKPGKEKAKA